MDDLMVRSIISCGILFPMGIAYVLQRKFADIIRRIDCSGMSELDNITLKKIIKLHYHNLATDEYVKNVYEAKSLEVQKYYVARHLPMIIRFINHISDIGGDNINERNVNIFMTEAVERTNYGQMKNGTRIPRRHRLVALEHIQYIHMLPFTLNVDCQKPLVWVELCSRLNNVFMDNTTDPLVHQELVQMVSQTISASIISCIFSWTHTFFTTDLVDSMCKYIKDNIKYQKQRGASINTLLQALLYYKVKLEQIQYFPYSFKKTWFNREKQLKAINAAIEVATNINYIYSKNWITFLRDYNGVFGYDAITGTPRLLLQTTEAMYYAIGEMHATLPSLGEKRIKKTVMHGISNIIMAAMAHIGECYDGLDTAITRENIIDIVAVSFKSGNIDSNLLDSINICETIGFSESALRENCEVFVEDIKNRLGQVELDNDIVAEQRSMPHRNSLPDNVLLSLMSRQIDDHRNYLSLLKLARERSVNRLNICKNVISFLRDIGLNIFSSIIYDSLGSHRISSQDIIPLEDIQSGYEQFRVDASEYRKIMNM